MNIKVFFFTAFMLLCSQNLVAQDFYEIRTAQTVFNYPESVGIEVMIDSVFTSDFVLSQHYDEIRVRAPWLDGFAVYRNAVISLTEHESISLMHSPSYEAPKLSKREIVRSSMNPDRFNLSATFSNQVVFEYLDGEVSASFNGEDIPLLESKYSDSYLIEFKDFLFKLTFYPSVGRFWYVVDNQHD